MASKQESSDGYVLSRNYAATSRLNLQHFLWRETFGYLLHPSLKVKEAESLRIADVGSEPGGYLQWGEPDAESVRLVKSNPSNPSESLERVYADMIGSMALFRPTWVKELYRAVEAEGLTEVINDRQSGPPHVWFAFNQCNMMIFDELLEQGKIPKEKQQEWRQLLDLANKECQQGATMLSDRLHVIGRKPT
ncbi:MAG: hypothetical protein Q9162_000363 [Coniocarpon cinnabarinum]